MQLHVEYANIGLKADWVQYNYFRVYHQENNTDIQSVFLVMCKYDS